MDKFQAIFEILYFLASIDGEIDPREVKVITSFMDANYGKINFNPLTVMKSISVMTSQGIIDELQRAAFVFKNTSNAQDRMVVLDFALQLIAADGKVTAAERDLFFLLGNVWDIDMPMYLSSKVAAW